MAKKAVSIQIHENCTVLLKNKHTQKLFPDQIWPSEHLFKKLS